MNTIFIKEHLLTKLSIFDGIPADKLLQGRFVLNVTTLDALYRLLDYSDAKFIILPKEDVSDENKLTQPVRFALDSFPHYYEDDKYVVLEVPPLSSPSSSFAAETDVALVLKQKYSNPESDVLGRGLQYNNETFNSGQLVNTLTVDNDVRGYQNKSQNIVLCSPKSEKNKGITVWSKGIDERDEAADKLC